MANDDGSPDATQPAVDVPASASTAAVLVGALQRVMAWLRRTVPNVFLRWCLIVLAAAASLVVLVSPLVMALYLVPELLNRRDFATPAERATAVNAARIPAAAVFAAAVAGIGVWVSHRGVVVARDTLKQTSVRDSATASLIQAGQYTDRYIKAIQLISDDQLNARLGGLYALEQLAKEAPTTYHAAIVDVLTAYVRDRAPWPPQAPPLRGPAATRFGRRVANGRSERTTPPQASPPRPASDVQAALTILGRRTAVLTAADGQQRHLENHALDLTQCDLRGANLGEAHLENADLAGTHLEGANLQWARLEHAYLDWAHLEEADVRLAHLERAKLVRTHLEYALLDGAHLRDAILHGTHLEGAGLHGTDLEGAVLREAHLENARGLRWEQVVAASGDDRTMLPARLHGPQGEVRPSTWLTTQIHPPH